MKMLFLGVIVAALGLSSCETPVGQGAGYGAAGGAIIGGLAGGTVRSAAIGAAAGAATGALIGAIVQENQRRSLLPRGASGRLPVRAANGRTGDSAEPLLPLLFDRCEGRSSWSPGD